MLVFHELRPRSSGRSSEETQAWECHSIQAGTGRLRSLESLESLERKPARRWADSIEPQTVNMSIDAHPSQSQGFESPYLQVSSASPYESVTYTGNSYLDSGSHGNTSPGGMVTWPYFSTHLRQLPSGRSGRRLAI